MTTIRYAYDPDLTKVGTVADLPDDEARILVRHGRAVLVPSADQLAAQTKAELHDTAAQAGVDVPASAPKADIIEAIQAAPI